MKGFWIVILVLVSISCSSNSDSEKVDDLKEEFPKVDLANYDTVAFENEFQFIVLKELTQSRNESDRALIGYSHLSKEKHIYIEQESKTTYVKSLEARKLLKKKGILLEKFADEYVDHLVNMWEVEELSPMTISEVNKLKNVRVSFQAKVNGFPRSKFYNIRFVEGKEMIYILVTWTVDKSKEQFEKEALAMGLSFKLL